MRTTMRFRGMDSPAANRIVFIYNFRKRHGMGKHTMQLMP